MCELSKNYVIFPPRPREKSQDGLFTYEHPVHNYNFQWIIKTRTLVSILKIQSKKNNKMASELHQVKAGDKVVLGFSGGLDTSYCVKYLTDEKGYEVHSVIVNTGGFSEEELKNIQNINQYSGVVLDESSILKGRDGKLSNLIIFAQCKM